ncbi:MAG TPA: imidazolonepropionase [Gemmatimonadaceae bacterium]|nr:imidazolonepropionase [Gemmatimonadaceae bacterium]
MKADRLLTNIGQLVTCAGEGAARGHAMRELAVTTDAAVAIAAGRIVWCGRRADWHGTAGDEVDAGGAAVVPGFVDPHTHLVWGGDRLADFEARASGASYESILARGGGIRHTVACTNAATDDDLLTAARSRAMQMLRAGSTTIEIKSGYGGDRAGEVRQLDVIRTLSTMIPARIAATMLFHLPPTDDAGRTGFLDDAVTNWIPSLAASQLATAVDVFIEREAFSVPAASMLLRAARAAELRVKAHADQFTAIGGTEMAISLGALSVDHLEASGALQIAALAASGTCATLLPGVTLHLGLPAAPGRALIDAGAVVAIGTDCNPGSSPLFSMGLALALAVRLNGLTPAEALTAATANAAAALGMPDVGRIAPGMRADLLVLRSGDWRDLPYVLGAEMIARVVVAGRDLPS